jgi:hypothetical protein
MSRKRMVDCKLMDGVYRENQLLPLDNLPFQCQYIVGHCKKLSRA